MSRVALARALATAAALVAAAPGFGAERVRVAVLPMVVHSLESPEYLEAGLADMLASRLGRQHGIAVLRVAGGSQRGTTDPDSARAAGRAVGAQYVVYGSFTRFGEGASLDLECAGIESAAAGTAREIFVQAGTLGDIIPKLDDVAEKVAGFVSHGASAFDGAAVASPRVGASAGELDELRRRVEALERALAAQPSASGPPPDVEENARESAGGGAAARSADPVR